MHENSAIKISVITVCYNSAGTIVDTLKSLSAQTYPNIEHIIVDGGSTDDTVALVREHGKHVKQLISEPDQGIYDAMNKGMKLATGDLVGFLNADDMLASPEVMTRMAAAASKYDAIYADLDYVDQQNESRVIRHWKSGKFAPARLRFGWMPPHPTFYIRRSLMQAVGKFDTGLRIAADYEYMIRCLTKPAIKVGYVPEIAVKMRVGGVSNRSLAAMLRKSREDLGVMKRHKIGGFITLAFKNLRKLHQFIT